MESNGDASACHGMSGRKLLFGNEIANPSVGQRRAPRAAMTSSTCDVTEVTAPYTDRALTISLPVFYVWARGIEIEAGCVGSRGWFELARSPTEPSWSMQNAQHQIALVPRARTERCARTST